MLGPGDVQAMDNHLIGDPDVDPEASVAFWIIAIILAIITCGAGSIFIAIIIIVVAAIVSAVAGSVGGSMMVDPVTGAITGISAWPPELARVGRVRAVFHDPIDIQPDGILLAGTLDVLSSCELTEVLAARSRGSYAVTAQQPLSLAAVSTSPTAAYTWSPSAATTWRGACCSPHSTTTDDRPLFALTRKGRSRSRSGACRDATRPFARCRA